MDVQDLLKQAQQLALAGKPAEAAAQCQAALQAQPDCVLAMRMLAILARESHRRDLAIEQLLAAVDVRPNDPQLWLELGNDLLELGRANEALPKYDRALRLEPDWAQAGLNRALALCELNRLDEAERAALKAVHELGTVEAHLAIARIYKQQLRLTDAIDSARRACQLDPTSAQAHWVLANYLLLNGQFAEGWREHEWRSQRDQVIVDPYPYPQWDGSSLVGKTILVHAEQGIGDEIFFASCYTDLVAAAGKCVFVCDPRLAPLLERSLPSATVHGYLRRADRAPVRLDEHIDFQIQAGSLPRYFRNDPSSFPMHSGYLQADPKQVSAWQERMRKAGGNVTVGISWRAGGEPCQQRTRTMPLTTWHELFALPGITWVNLQYGEVAAEIKQAEQCCKIKIHDWPDADPLVDLDGFAAKLSALDLVISVGNATAHLAGALGLPVWVLVPRIPIWRWMAYGAKSPWYPSATILRQEEAGDWGRLLSVVANKLRQWLQLNEAEVAPQVACRNSVRSAFQGQAFHIASAADADLMAAYGEACRCREAGNLDRAEQICRALLSHAPRHAQAQHLLATICLAKRNFVLAIVCARRAIAIQPNGLFFFTLARALAATADADAAVDNYRVALEHKPHFHAARRCLAQLLESQGRTAEAAIEYSELCRRCPQADDFVNLGKVQQQLGRFGDAQAAFDAAVALDPRCVRAWHAKGTLHLQTKSAHAAREALEHVLRIDPSHVAARHNLAVADQRIAQGG